MNKKNLAPRNRRGNMLILVTAVILAIIMVLLFFMLGFVRLTGTQSEQRTAIESAALAAAREISNIVIVDDNFGHVGLSDSAPIGTNTAAGDNYYTQVHGINTLIGTSLLDYIIATELGSTEMQKLAVDDKIQAETAATTLMTAIQNSIIPGGTALDKDGNTIRPYQTAVNAYTSNQVRMTGGSTYKAGSLQLSLGAITGGLPTNIELPRGWTGSFPASVTSGNNYKSYQPISFGGRTWVFAGVGSAVKLLDPAKWVPNATGVPFQHRTILRAEAIQDINNQGQTVSVRAAAVAQPASVYDPLPAPGALMISFPDGPPDGLCAMRRINDLYGGCLSDGNDDSDVHMAMNGDYPVDAASMVAPDTYWPIPGDTQKQAANACKIAVYDWIRRGGTKANVGAIVNMHNVVFNAPNPATVNWPPGGAPGAKPIPNGVAHIFRYSPTGTVTYQSKQIDPVPYYVISDKQMLVESFEVLTNGAATSFNVKPINLGPPMMNADGEAKFTLKYDLFIRDYARRPGAPLGGKHAGEPLDDPLVAHKASQNQLAMNTISHGGVGAKPKSSGGGGNGGLPLILPQEDFAFYFNGTAMAILRDPAVYKSFQPGSGLRSTYQTNGTVCDIRFRRQLQVINATTTTVDIPVVDPVTGATVIDPVTGAATTVPTSTTTVTSQDIGYVGLK